MLDSAVYSSLFVIGTSVTIAIYFIKRRQIGRIKLCACSRLLKGKTALITGASSGLGLQLARELVSRQCRVIVACRSSEVARMSMVSILDDETVRKLVSFVDVDLTDLNSVKSCGEQILKSERNLHFLVNNAGIMAAPFSRSAQGYEMHFAVNHLAHAYLTRLLEPLLLNSEDSRVVNVSSGYYKKGKPEFWLKLDSQSVEHYDKFVAYGNSKLANCLHAVYIADEFKGKLDTCAVRPGFVRNTNLGRYFSPIFRIIAFPLIWFYSKNVAHGVQTMLHCCLVGTIESGKLYDNCDVTEYEESLVNIVAAKDFRHFTDDLIEQFETDVIEDQINNAKNVDS